MAQGYDKYELDNQTGQSFRFALNDILEAAVTQNSGDNSPNTTNTSYPYQVWVDTTNDIVKIRDAATAGSWYSLYSVDSDGKPTGAVSYGSYSIATNDTAGTGGTTAITVDTSQRVGIGTTTPVSDAVLTLSTDSDTALFFRRGSGTNQDGAIRFEGGDFQFLNGANSSTVAGLTERMRIGSDGTFAVVHPSGNAVQLAAGTPSAPLVRDAQGHLLVGTGTARSNIYVSNTAYTPSQQVESSGSSYSSGLSLLKYSSAGYAPILTLGASASNTAGTNALIGNGSDLGIVSFVGNDGTNFREAARIQVGVDGTPGSLDMPGRILLSTTPDGGIAPAERMRISNGGQISQYSDTGWENIRVSSASSAGTSRSFFQGYYSATGVNTGTLSYRVYTNGNVQNTNNSYGALSDVKLKENIVDANSQWNDLKAIQVRNYNFKEGQTHTQLGVVAQEVELVSPGLVTESPDRDEEGNDLGTVTKSVNYSVLYMKAVKALQEAMDRIETLEAKVAALESA